MSMESRPQTSHSQAPSDPFSAFKNKIKSNVRGHASQNMASSGPAKENGYPHQQNYVEDVRKVDLFNKSII